MRLCPDRNRAGWPFLWVLTLTVVAAASFTGGGRVEGPVSRLVSAPTSSAVQTVPGDACNVHSLGRSDDGSAGPVTLPFPVSFFGRTYSSVYVNNNGSVTFDGPLAMFTPFGLSANLGTPIIAPFFADVDTTGANSGVVHYGATADTFCVDWTAVGYFSGGSDKLNTFQLLLIDRAHNVGGHPGDFDIVMNYDTVVWEAGSASGGNAGLGGSAAHVGYSNGTGQAGSYFELPGSGVAGALLDSSPTGLVRGNRGAPGINGQYVFTVRSGAVPTTGSVGGGVYGPTGSAADAVTEAAVQACPGGGGPCRTTLTGSDGSYRIDGLNTGTYTITAFPPANTALRPQSLAPVTVPDGEAVTDLDLTLSGPAPLPSGTTITNRFVTSAGEPVVYQRDQLTLTTHGCADGTASYTLVAGARRLAGGSLTQARGTYTATIAPLADASGDARLGITVVCPDGTQSTVDFDLYVQASGQVLDQGGAPLAGATVTLLRSESADGPFSPVPTTSGLLSSVNRRNPDLTDARGLFGWEPAAGYYQVRAEKANCASPADPAQSYVTSPVILVPANATGVRLVLSCPAHLEHAPVANGQALATQVAQPVAARLSATDVDGDPLTYAVASQPSHGILSGTAPALTYTPAAGYSGTDSFTFTADDGQLRSAPATVTITVTRAVSAPCPTVAPAVDALVSADSPTPTTTITANGLTTRQPRELVLAFISSDGPVEPTQQVVGVTGGGLTWSRAAQSGAGWGATEVWQAYAPDALTGVDVTATFTSAYGVSMSVATFTGGGNAIATGVAATGVGSTGRATITPTGCGSLIWAVGHNWSDAATPVLPSGQSPVHVFTDQVAGDAYWIQKLDSPTQSYPVTMSASGFSGRWTLVAVEIDGTSG